MRISDWSSDVCSSDLKIGTYLKALAAQANGVPFYVALPSPTIDWTLRDGVKEIPIEERSGEEVAQMTGSTASGTIETGTIAPAGRSVANSAFAVPPARSVTGLITERGTASASPERFAKLFPEWAS